MNRLTWLIAAAACTAAPLRMLSAELVRDGRTDYVVVIGTNGEYDKFAAEEFTEIMQKSTGAEFPAAASGSPEAASGKRIFIGDSPEMRKFMKEDEIKKLQKEESLVRESDGNLIIVGGGKHGTAYGVYHFLEEEVGYRCFSLLPGGERIPSHPTLITSGRTLHRKPAFSLFRNALMSYLYGDMGALYVYRNAGTPVLRYNRKMKGHGLQSEDPALDSGHGFNLYITDQNHINFYPWKNPQDYFKTHPEYFSLGTEGQRTSKLQVCFSNPELRKEFLARILERCEATGGQGHLTIGANDWPGSFCYCAGCKALEEKYGTNGGAFIDFLLEICPKVKEKYPGITIWSLSYRKKQTEIPPRNVKKMPDNWVCDFAPVDDDQGQAIDGPRNMNTLDNLRQWSKITDNISYWFYLCNRFQPYGLVERLSRDMRLIYENGVRGMGICGLAQPGMYPMQEYILLRLAVDPYQDPWKLVEEYNQHMYGAAAPEITDYIREIEDIWRRPKRYVGLEGCTLSEFTPEFLVRWHHKFDELEKRLANSPFELANLKVCRWDIEYMLLCSWDSVRRDVKSPGFTPDDVIAKMRETDLPFYYGKGKAKLAENAYLVAKALDKPLAAPLDKVPAYQIRQFPQCGGYFGKDDPDAACGNAKTQHLRENHMQTIGRKIGFDFYDQAARRNVAHGTVDLSKCTPGKYELYHVLDTVIPRGASLHFDTWWGIGADLSSCYPEGDEFKVFEIWASLKCVGPDFGIPTDDGKNRVFCDRVIVVDRSAKE